MLDSVLLRCQVEMAEWVESEMGERERLCWIELNESYESAVKGDWEQLYQGRRDLRRKHLMQLAVRVKEISYYHDIVRLRHTAWAFSLAFFSRVAPWAALFRSNLSGSLVWRKPVGLGLDLVRLDEGGILLTVVVEMKKEKKGAE
jgi:hypothetical protein